MLEINRLIAEVKEQDDVRILPGDPAFALVTLNQLTLEDLTRRLNEELRQSIAEFGDIVQRTEARAGTRLARQAKDEASEIREELRKEIEAARLNAAEAIDRINHAYRQNALIWVGLLFVTALLMTFCIGLWVGSRLL